METFDIFFEDLNEDVQKQLLEFMDSKSSMDWNWDVFPVAVVNKPETG